jgi:predicted metal-binding protein
MPDAPDPEFLVARALDLGVTDAKIIDAASIVVAPWPQLKCQFGCGGYGSNLCCPPHAPDWKLTREVVGAFKRALLLHTKGGSNLRSIATTVEREAFLAGFYKAFAFGCGPCLLCKGCNLESCIHPHEARPAPEASGIDVFASARNNGFPIEVLTSRECVQNNYTFVLLD